MANQQLAEALELATIEGARNRDPEAATQLWRWVAADLRRNASLSGAARAFLADALDGAIDNPAKAGHAFGLIGKKARPKDPRIALRHAEIVNFILRLQRMGFGPHEKHEGDTTLAHVAKHFSTSLRTVQRAWGEYTGIRTAVESAKAQRA